MSDADDDADKLTGDLEEKDETRDEVHPLLALFNRTVLHNLFQFLDLKTLKAARSTCSVWKEVAGPILQKRSKVNIAWYHGKDLSHRPTLSTFMTYVDAVTPIEVFFRNYKLHEWQLHPKEEETIRFWVECGQHIRSLWFDGDNYGFHDDSLVRKVFFTWTPKLEMLSINSAKFLNHPNYQLIDMKKFMKEKGEKRKELLAHRKAKPREEAEIGQGEVRGRIVHVFRDDDVSSDSDEDWFEGIRENSIEDVDIDKYKMQKFSILSDICPNPNLHTLKLDLQDFDCLDLPIPWKEVFLAYPNLETLRTIPIMCDDDDNIMNLLTSLVEFQKEFPGKLSNLKCLDVFSYFYDDEGATTNVHFKLAQQLRFPLESLILDACPRDSNALDSSTIANYIRKFNLSLKFLSIKAQKHPSTPLPIFPPPGPRILFPELETLKIGFEEIYSNSLEFLELTPKLKFVEFGYLGASGLSMTPLLEPRLVFNTITLHPLLTLKSFKMAGFVLTVDCIKKMGDWFPNLVEFLGVLNDELLEAVFKYLGKSLEVLLIVGDKFSDDGVTGNTRPSPNEPSTSETIIPEQEHKTDDEREKTGITQMRKLRTLMFCPASTKFSEVCKIYGSSSNVLELTDEAVTRTGGLAEVKTLKILELPESKITEHGFRYLVKNVALEKLSTPYVFRGEGDKTFCVDDGLNFRVRRKILI